MRYHLVIIYIIVIFSNILAPLQASSSSNELIANAMSAMKAKNWSEATIYAKKSNNKILLNIINSQKFLAKNEQHAQNQYSFEDVTVFLNKNPHWPQYNELISRAEQALTTQTNYKAILNWFRLHPPISSKARLLYAIAEVENYKKLKSATAQDQILVTNAIRGAWIYSSFSVLEERNFLNLHKNYLRYTDHFKRINELLWLNNVPAANRLLHMMNKADQMMFKAQIAILTQQPQLEQLFNSLSDTQKLRSGILFAYIKYHHNVDPQNDMSHLLVKAPHDTEHAHSWWRLKTYYIRELIKLKEYDKAFHIAQHHHAVNITDTVDAHWLAGWLALRFLQKPEVAIVHFKKLYGKVSYPISLARGAYWIGESYKALGRENEMRIWYKKAANFSETFYGQLAATKINIVDINLPTKPPVNPQDSKALANNELFNAANLLLDYGCETLALKYIKQAINKSSSPGEIFLMVELMKHKGSAATLIEAAKSAAHKKVMISQYNYPKPYRAAPKFVEEPLTYAIIRQESVFNVGAISTANAMGLMQLIEPTARSMASQLKISYNKTKLLSDPHYNIKLGTKYLHNMLETFHGSYIMTAAAYNAGPNSVQRWININGDPRTMSNIDDIVDWIELIPYYQTRDYVMRVLENIQIYRYILGKSKTLRLNSDIRRGK